MTHPSMSAYTSLPRYPDILSFLAHWTIIVQVSPDRSFLSCSSGTDLSPLRGRLVLPEDGDARVNSGLSFGYCEARSLFGNSLKSSSIWGRRQLFNSAASKLRTSTARPCLRSWTYSCMCGHPLARRDQCSLHSSSGRGTSQRSSWFWIWPNELKSFWCLYVSFAHQSLS